MKLPGLLVVTVVFTLIITATTDGPSNGRSLRALAAPELVTDELQIALGGNGFTPDQVEHAAGTFAIAVENSNVVGEYTLMEASHPQWMCRIIVQ